MSCRVALSSASKRAPLAGPFSARVALVLPDRQVEAAASRPDARDPYNVLRDVFDAIDRKLGDSDRIRRAEIERRTPLGHGPDLT